MDTKAESVALAVIAIAVLASLMLLFVQSNSATAEETTLQEETEEPAPAEEEPQAEEEPEAEPAEQNLVDVCHYTGSDYKIKQVEFEHLVEYLVNNPYDSTNLDNCA